MSQESLLRDIFGDISGQNLFTDVKLFDLKVTGEPFEGHIFCSKFVYSRKFFDLNVTGEPFEGDIFCSTFVYSRKLFDLNVTGEPFEGHILCTAREKGEHVSKRSSSARGG